MRTILLILAASFTAHGQFKSTVELVVAPVTVTDSKERVVDGLNASDLMLYDNNVQQAIQMEMVSERISLVVAIQSSSSSVAILDKLGRTGILLSQLLAGDLGETALVSFSDDVKVIQEFTNDPDKLTRTLQNLRMDGHGAATLDALMQALKMLGRRKPGERKVILMIGESRDRSSKVEISSVILEAQRQNASIYWLTYSTFLAPFTNRQKTVGDRKKVEDRGKDPKKDAEVLPPDWVPGSWFSVFTELAHKSKVDAAALLSRTNGARTIFFLKQAALEEAIAAIGDEVHRQYIVSFQPAPAEAGEFHSIRVEVRGRPELHARTRTGYWAIP